MNSVAAELVARADQMKPKSVEYDMPQILISFARLGIPGLEGLAFHGLLSRMTYDFDTSSSFMY